MPIRGAEYVASSNIAKHTDFSCVVVMAISTGHVVGFDHFNRIDYSEEVKRVEAIARKYNNARVVLESVKVTGLSVEGTNLPTHSRS